MIKGDYIPDDIVVDILSKLPSRSVLRFKIACKTWYFSISDPVFINLHSKRAHQNPKILFSTARSQLRLLDYESQSFNDSCLSCPIKFLGKTSRDHAKIVGSSRGLVCVAIDSSGKRFIILNPLTGESRKIPKLSCQDITSNKCYFHGLGYDFATHDFKLVLTTDRITFHIFSLKTNSWTIIKCGPVAFGSRYAMLPTGTLATVLNGMFYWLVEPRPLSYCEIVAFDIGRETFEKVQLPQHVTLKSWRAASLLECKGRLCLSFELSDSKEIWMMKEYGGWVRLLAIKNPMLYNCVRLPVLCISTRNEALFHAGFKFMRCEKKENKLDEIGVEEYVYGAVLYVETLISPNTRKLTIKRKRQNKLIYQC